jgi:hypothetical protein
MSAPDLVNLSALIDDAKCFALVRQQRWPEGVHCPACGSGSVVRGGFDETQAHRQRYRCKACAGRFDDLTGTLLAGHHQRDCPLTGGIMPLWQRSGRHWRSGQIDAQTRHQAYRCRLRSGPGAADRRPVAIIAFAGICSCTG